MTPVLVIAALWLMSGVVFCLALCAAAHKPVPRLDSHAREGPALDDSPKLPQRERPPLADAA